LRFAVALSECDGGEDRRVAVKGEAAGLHAERGAGGAEHSASHEARRSKVKEKHRCASVRGRRSARREEGSVATERERKHDGAAGENALRVRRRGSDGGREGRSCIHNLPAGVAKEWRSRRQAEDAD